MPTLDRVRNPPRDRGECNLEGFGFCGLNWGTGRSAVSSRVVLDWGIRRHGQEAHCDRSVCIDIRVARAIRGPGGSHDPISSRTLDGRSNHLRHRPRRMGQAE